MRLITKVRRSFDPGQVQVIDADFVDHKFMQQGLEEVVEDGGFGAVRVDLKAGF